MHPRLIAALAALLCIAPQALAQTAPSCSSPGTIGGRIWGVDGGKDAPYTAVTKTTFEQKLGDGNAIHAESHARQARDSAGRTMIEMVQGCERGVDGQYHPRLRVQVSDPVARTMTSWQVSGMMPSQVAQVSPMPQLLPAPMPTPARKQLTPEEQQVAQAQQAARQMEIQAQRNQTKTEQLGTKLINGIEATGTRTTRTIPVGDVGNDLPLAIVQEIWRSRKLNITVMAIDDDPRRSKMTFEIQELNFGEPDPALFAPPPDYKVQEQHPFDQGQQIATQP